MADAPAPPTAPDRRRALLDALGALDRDAARLRAELGALAAGERLPGLHVVARAAESRLLLPAARIAELALVVALDPVPGAPRWVRGAFVWRGRPALAVDLAARLGGPCAGGADAMLVILDGTPTVALVVDEIRELVERPPVAGDEGARGLFAAACRVGEEVLPALAPEILEREAWALAPSSDEVPAARPA